MSSRNSVLYVLTSKEDLEKDTLPPNPFISCIILKLYPEVGLTTEFVLSRLYEKISALLFSYAVMGRIRDSLMLLMTIRTAVTMQATQTVLPCARQLFAKGLRQAQLSVRSH